MEAKYVGCKVTGCDRPHRARGLCRTHYMRNLRTGSPFIDGRRDRAARTAASKPAGRIQDQLTLGPSALDGTITLEQWRRFRAEPRADVHHIQPVGGGAS